VINTCVARRVLTRLPAGVSARRCAQGRRLARAPLVLYEGGRTDSLAPMLVRAGAASVLHVTNSLQHRGCLPTARRLAPDTLEHDPRREACRPQARAQDADRRSRSRIVLEGAPPGRRTGTDQLSSAKISSRHGDVPRHCSTTPTQSLTKSRCCCSDHSSGGLLPDRSRLAS
jgi:hypothetical protein